MVDTINFDKIPFIGLTEKTFSKIGYLSDYVDSLYWDIVQYPVMWGYGPYKTKFIIIKCSQNGKKIGIVSDQNRSQHGSNIHKKTIGNQ